MVIDINNWLKENYLRMVLQWRYADMYHVELKWAARAVKMCFNCRDAGWPCVQERACHKHSNIVGAHVALTSGKRMQLTKRQRSTLFLHILMKLHKQEGNGSHSHGTVVVITSRRKAPQSSYFFCMQRLFFDNFVNKRVGASANLHQIFRDQFPNAKHCRRPWHEFGFPWLCL